MSKFLYKNKDKITIIPNGINIEEFDAQYTKEGARKILSNSRRQEIVLYLALYEKKAPHLLLEAIPQVLDHIKDVYFIFVGGGDVERYKKLLLA
ncbi:MAG: hypothetical protein QXR18_06480 [Pyrobaculum sp.]